MFKISIIINQLSDVNINGVKSQVSQIQMPIHLPFIFILVLAYKQMYNNEVFTMSDFFQLLEVNLQQEFLQKWKMTGWHPKTAFFCA